MSGTNLNAGIKRTPSMNSVASAGGKSVEGEKAAKPRKMSDGASSVRSGGEDMKVPPQEGFKPVTPKEIDTTGSVAGGKPVEVTVFTATVESAVPVGTVGDEAIVQARQDGLLVRFSPDGSVAGDGYFAGGATVSTDKAAAREAKMMKSMGMDSSTLFLSNEAWNQRLGASIASGVHMTVNNAKSSDGTMGGVLADMNGLHLRLLHAGESGGRQEPYHFQQDKNQPTFNKLGKTSLEGMKEAHDVGSLGEVGRQVMGEEFLKLKDTPENRKLLAETLSQHLTAEVSGHLNDGV